MPLIKAPVPGALPLAPSYIIFRENMMTKALNCKTGLVEFSGIDAATVIQSAIDALTEGGKIFVKTGEYTLTSGLTIMQDYIALFGEGRGTVLKGALATSFVTIGNGATTIRGFSIRNLYIDGTDQTAGHGIFFNGGPGVNMIFDAIVRNVIIYDCASEGIYLNRCERFIVEGNIVRACRDGIYLSEAHYNLINDNQFTAETPNHGVLLYHSRFNVIVGNEANRNGTGSGIVLTGFSDHTTVIGNMLTENGEYGIYQNVEYADAYNTFIGNDVHGNPLGGIKILAGGANIIKNNIGYVTENRGTATIAAGATSVMVAHGLADTPTKVLVTPRADIGDVWVSARDATNITINCDTAPAAEVIVDWYAEV